MNLIGNFPYKNSKRCPKQAMQRRCLLLHSNAGGGVCARTHTRTHTHTHIRTRNLSLSLTHMQARGHARSDTHKHTHTRSFLNGTNSNLFGVVYLLVSWFARPPANMGQRALGRGERPLEEGVQVATPRFFSLGQFWSNSWCLRTEFV